MNQNAITKWSGVEGVSNDSEEVLTLLLLCQFLKTGIHRTNPDFQYNSTSDFSLHSLLLLYLQKYKNDIIEKTKQNHEFIGIRKLLNH